MNKPLVLVVEDDTPVRNLITTTLKTHEYRYLSAQNGASAVMEALSHNPDIVLLDLGLPDNRPPRHPRPNFIRILCSGADHNDRHI